MMAAYCIFVFLITFGNIFASPTNKDEVKYCGGVIQEPGILKSPNSIQTSSKNTTGLEELKNAECVWHIEAPKNKKVVLKIKQVSLPKPKSLYWCSTTDSHIAIFDGIVTNLLENQDNQLARICNRRNTTLVIPSSENALTVQLKAESLGENEGFISEVIFTYPESDGCGGNINLTSAAGYNLKSPQVTTQTENILDCQWNFVAPIGMAIKVSFSSFQMNSCQGNHALEIRDGILPDSLLIGSYCEANVPTVVISSANKMSIRLSSDIRSEFTAILTIQESTCNSTLNNVGYERYHFSPGYGTNPLARGIHCGYEFRAPNHIESPILVRIKNLDIQPGSVVGKCDKDKLIISTRQSETTSRSDYQIQNLGLQYLFYNAKLTSVYNNNIYLADHYELCGSQELVEFYFPRTVFINLLTTSNAVSKAYKGVEIEVSYKDFCGRNYTEPYGRIMNGPDQVTPSEDCNTLISAPEGYTISLYFISCEMSDVNDMNYLKIYDGKATQRKSEIDNSLYTKNNPVFSTSNHLLLKNTKSETNFDANYMITNKGRGCGGYMFANQGVVTSPLYPEIYNENKSCEWELETPIGTRLHMRFVDFDLGEDCTSNFVQLMSRDGNILTSFCSEKPTFYTSDENYIKIISKTASSNNGKGWQVLFAGVS